MAKQANQKLKILYLLEYLQSQSDENHPQTMANILAELQKHDITAERKSIYNDVELLRKFGYDIQLNRSRVDGGYFLGARDFELPELKILVDTIQASNFLTPNNTRDLIKKLSRLCSNFEAKQLRHEVHVIDRVKSPNESVFYNVDAINHALEFHTVIQFSYCFWNEHGKLVEKNKTYTVGPLGLIYQNENYYLVAIEYLSMEKRHYRVDKMKNIQITKEKMERELWESFNLVQYSNENFGMFAGKTETVRLHVHKNLLGVVIDRFGSEISLRKLDDDYFEISVKVAVSGQFFGWLAGLGSDIVIASDEGLKKQYIEYLEAIIHKQSLK